MYLLEKRVQSLAISRELKRVGGTVVERLLMYFLVYYHEDGYL